jgi:four helix bundle protein
MPSRDYRDLIAWKKSFELALEIYRETSYFPIEERYGITHQIRKACISIPSNIAEGEGRTSTEFRRYLTIALGSLKEVETQLLISDALEYIKPDRVSEIMAMAGEVGRLLHGLSKSLKRGTRDHRFSLTTDD